MYKTDSAWTVNVFNKLQVVTKVESVAHADIRCHISCPQTHQTFNL